jgi:hypothetical protein
MKEENNRPRWTIDKLEAFFAALTNSALATLQGLMYLTKPNYIPFMFPLFRKEVFAALYLIGL